MDPLGQVLTEDIYSPSTNVAPLDNATTDGYAVQLKDTYGARVVSPPMTSLALPPFIELGHLIFRSPNFFTSVS